MNMSERAASTLAEAAEDALGVRPLNAREFEKIRRLAREKFGLDLRQGKEPLVAARLGKRIRESRFRTFEQYFEHVLADSSGEALAEMIDSLSTNFTSFLREPAHFEFLRKKIIPELGCRSKIEIWSAACSTGEEPYSILFTLLDVLGDSAPVHILASDISRKVLQKAQAGVFQAERLESLPQSWMRRFFLRGQGQWEGWYRVKPEVAGKIEFRRVNLIEPFPSNWRYPAIFCRNVMIYFERSLEESVARRLGECLEPGGHLLIGHAESLTGMDVGLEYVRPAVYRKSSRGKT
jgi:chemotaxis protein methyltransferase CheR